MNWTLYGAFLIAAFVVAAAPGPTVLQIFSHATSGDPRRPASLIAGSIFANTIMVSATVIGIIAVIIASQSAFTVLRWVGSGYLICLGLYYWRMRAAALTASGSSAEGSSAAIRYRVLFMQAALTSLTNPKGLVFYIAFLPQFVSAGADPHVQLGVLGASYIGLCVIADTGYALAGQAFSGLIMTSRMVRLRNRITGTVLVGAGLSLLRYERA